MNTQLVPGQILAGRYQIVRYISKGGMSQIYQAWDVRAQQHVAIKLARHDSDHALTFVERLRYEAQVLAKISHPNIVRLLDYQESNQWAFLVLQWIPGRSLKELLQERHQPFQATEITPWIQDICSALGYLHNRGIIHCDLKPSNILIYEQHAVLLDFSVAQVHGRLLPFPYDPSPAGTIAYMAPEQLEGKVLDARADIYALGTIIYELLTLKRPFHNVERLARSQSAWGEILLAKSQSQPLSVRDIVPAIAPSIADVVAHAMARRPAERWTSAKDLWRAWIAAVHGSHLPNAILSNSPSVQRRSTTPIARNVALLLVFLIIAGIMAGLLLANPVRQRVAINKCQVVPLEFSIDTGRLIYVEWTNCVDSIDISNNSTRVHVSWTCQLSEKEMQIERPADFGNERIYLLTDDGRRLFFTQIGGAAAQTVQFQSGDRYSGWYEFPMLYPKPSRFAFVDDDIGVKIWIDVP